MARLPLIPEETGDPILRAVFDRSSVAGTTSVHLYRTLGHSPRMLKAYVDLAWPLRHEPISPRPLRELIIMRVGQLTKTRYEWAHHWKLALDSGVSEEKLRALGSWWSSPLYSDEEKVVLAYTDEITKTVTVSDGVYANIARRFPPEQVIELTLTASFYSGVARFLQALQIDVEPGFETVIEAM